MNLKIFTSNVEQKAIDQIDLLLSQEPFKDCKVRIMPDVHAGKGCVIGFTADLGNKVIPNIVGVDIGCGMLTVNLGNIDIDYKELDKYIRSNIPSGRNVRETVLEDTNLKDFKCYKSLKEYDWIKKSLGTLGGGNHFIEIDEDKNGIKYLIIHTGSRNLGKQVAELYQDKAISNFYYSSDFYKEFEEIKQKLIKEKRQSEISSTLIKLKDKYKKLNSSIPKELCYLENEDRDDYLFDMSLSQKYALKNRELIGELICSYLKVKPKDKYHTIHNYINFEDNIVRKGSISARKGEKVIIPMNMRDGCIVALGKGNDDWNNSAPHGAGRLFSRRDAKKLFSLDEYKKSMDGIYTTSISNFTIDEAPMAYKKPQEIIDNIKDTVEVIDIIKPVYNFKAPE